MSAPGPAHHAQSYRALALRYADRETTYAEAYYQWSSYGEPDGPLAMAYYFWLLQPTEDAFAPPIVVDCGFDPQLGARKGRRCLCDPAECLARVGVDPAAIQLLVLTHIHWDHVGNLHLFPNAHIAVARAELDFWLGDPVATRGQYAHHADQRAIDQLRQAVSEGRVEVIEERAQPAPGITAVVITGHAPGQLLLEVTGEHEPLVLASDAIHYYEELDTDRPFAIFHDLAGMYRGYDRLREYAAEGAAIAPGHDPLVMALFPRVDGDAAEIAVCLTDTRSEE